MPSGRNQAQHNAYVDFDIELRGLFVELELKTVMIPIACKAVANPPTISGSI
jgi:hypothetical protein